MFSSWSMLGSGIVYRSEVQCVGNLRPICCGGGFWLHQAWCVADPLKQSLCEAVAGRVQLLQAECSVFWSKLLGYRFAAVSILE